MKSRRVTFVGEQWSIADLAKAYGLRPGTLYSRIFISGMSVEDAVTKKVRSHLKEQKGRPKVGLASKTCVRNTHWAIRKLFRIINMEKVPISVLSKRAGVEQETIRSWRKASKGNPGLMNIEACLNTLGYKFKIVPMGVDDE